MGRNRSLPREILWHKGPFQFINPDDFDEFGIDPAYVPVGTYVSFKHPSQLRSRFGGNAYGVGLFEDYDRLKPQEVKQLHSIKLENPEEIRLFYRELNEIYRKMGLLIRFSSHGKRYYLIPVHLISNSLFHIKARVEEISKVIGFHRKKYLKESYTIGVLSHHDDLILNELSFRFMEHSVIPLDSLERLRGLGQSLDMVILTSDIYELAMMEEFTHLARESLSKNRLDQYCTYLIWRVWSLLKPGGEVFLIADHFTPRTNQTTELIFKTTQEEKNFALFSHIFRTRKKYRIEDHTVTANVSDFQKYLSGSYVEREIVDNLLGGKSLEEISLEEIDGLPYINSRSADWPFAMDQGKNWPRLFENFFDEIFLKPVVPDSVKREWEKRFSCRDYSPKYMMVYLGQKKVLETSIDEVKRDVMESGLSGCAIELVADYKDSFEYLIQTLKVVSERLKRGSYQVLPQIFADRLKQPLENKSRRFKALNHVVRLTTKIKRLERIRRCLNPDAIEGQRTRLLDNLDVLSLFGFSYDELKEIVLIVLGHTALGRIILGKVTEKALKPVSDLARTYDPHQALNLLRYCRLMTLAETEAARGAEITHEQLSQLFDLYESTVRVVVNQELDWDQLLDEKIAAMGGIHNKIIQKILMMMNYFEFVDNWGELKQKGQMEKEALADYNERKFARIENVIRLMDTIEEFEEIHLKRDPLQLPLFYRRFLEMEFHGTGHLFERMDSRNVFVLLWIAVTLARGEIINFNPILAHLDDLEVESRVRKAEEDAWSIKVKHLDLEVLRRFGERLKEAKSSFIMGTGFHLSISPETEALEIAYKDISRDIEKISALPDEILARPVSEIPGEDLKNLEKLFSDLEPFFQSHLRIVEETGSDFKLPARQKRWFQETGELRELLRSYFIKTLFRPERLYSDLAILFYNAPSLLNFLLPEFMALKDLDMPGHIYLTYPVTDYILAAAKKFQALITHDSQDFQDTGFLHRLAQREFGPMAAGIVGLSEVQLENLGDIIEGFKGNSALLNALAKSIIFQDMGRVPVLREKYREEINQADLAGTSAFFIKRERIAERYRLNEEEESYLIFLVEHHALLHHAVRGEISFSAIESILASRDRDLLDAFFVFSFIMLSALREDLILEDLAARFFQLRTTCHRILDGEITLKEELNKTFMERGALFCAMEKLQGDGLPKGVSLTDYLESGEWKEANTQEILRAGRMIVATERIFRLRGIRYVEFQDLVNLMLKLPLKYIHRKRKFHNVGYATFEKEVYEAFRIYKTLQTLPEPIRHFMLEQLIGDRVRIFGYEKVGAYLSYQSQVKLLLIGLLGAEKIGSGDNPVFVSFLGMSEEIEKRYEAVNDSLDDLSIEELWAERGHLTSLFSAKKGIVLGEGRCSDLLTVTFRDPISISRKISYLASINDLEELKNYFHFSLSSLRKHPFYTEDYELILEKAFEKRMREITDMILERAERQMGLVKDLGELHNLINDLRDRSLEIGFSRDQIHRLNDFYEMRKDVLKREKLAEVEGILKGIHDPEELKDYWQNIKWYLQGNRRFFGKEFEYLIARKFDEVSASIA